VWFGRPSRALWQALAIAGTAGFACALGVHFAVGYTDALHLAPAMAGAAQLVLALALTAPEMLGVGHAPRCDAAMERGMSR
jgi:hypothetical protein